MNRYFIVNFCGAKSLPYSVNAGVLHGSVLGQVLFNIFINSLPKSRKTGLAVYVDDTAIYTSLWRCITLLTHRLQTHIDDILQFLSDWKMSINPDKTEAVVFTRKIHRLPPLIRILNYAIPSRNVKYLGVILDSDLRWSTAITDRINKINATWLNRFEPFEHRTSTRTRTF